MILPPTALLFLVARILIKACVLHAQADKDTAADKRCFIVDLLWSLELMSLVDDDVELSDRFLLSPDQYEK